MRSFPFALLITCLPLSIHAGPLNDTGIDFCRNLDTEGLDTPVTSTANCSPVQGGQDGRYGRDAAASKGALPKVGSGGKGFDFTKIANNGTALPATAGLGSAPTEWACTYDNNTGLMLEVKTTSGLRNQAHTYSWYDSVHNYNGSPGTPSGGGCETVGRCDTEKFGDDVNTVGLCGHNDWRTPALPELFNLADRSRSIPAIDPTYFPNTLAEDFWSSSPFDACVGTTCINNSLAWYLSFFHGGRSSYAPRISGMHVRLVRVGR
jgi:hypothetical protein